LPSSKQHFLLAEKDLAKPRRTGEEFGFGQSFKEGRSLQQLNDCVGFRHRSFGRP
jgi:hypothetical protein